MFEIVFLLLLGWNATSIFSLFLLCFIHFHINDIKEKQINMQWNCILLKTNVHSFMQYSQ